MRIGLIGTGLMGKPIAQKLLDANYKLGVFNRTVSKAKELEKSGALVYANINELLKDSDVILVMLSNYDAIEEVLLNNNDNRFEDKTIIQMSTIASSESVELNETIIKLGGDYFEAPVLGSIPQIISGELIVLVGSTEKQFKKFNNLFNPIGNKILHIGKVGDASAMKLALNQLIITETIAFSMSLGFVRENNLDVEMFMDIVRNSALYAPTFDKKLPRMLKRDFENPNFPVKHLLKDLDLMLGEFANKNVNTNALKGIRKVLVDSIESGYSDLDYSVLYNSIHKNL